MMLKSLVALCALLGTAAHAESPIHLRPFEYSLSAERLVSYDPDNYSRQESLGLGGARIDLNFDSGARLGFGAFFSIAGPRGGLILVGADLGYRLAVLPHLYLQPELFLGGGGGSRVPVGGGLMVRPSASVQYDFGPIVAGVGYAWTRFPNGMIDSRSPFVQIAIPSELAFLDSTPGPARPSERLAHVGWEVEHWRVGAIGEGLFTSGKTDIRGRPIGSFNSLAGIALEHQLGADWFTMFRIEGATSGEIAGFLRTSLGLGYALKLGAGVTLAPLLQAGVAGGAGLSTGGGVTVQPEAALSVPVFDPISLRLAAGYLLPLGGDFRVPTASAALTTRFDGLGGHPVARVSRSARGARVTRSDWRISLSSQRYFTRGRTARSGSLLEDIDLLGIGFDYALSPRFFFAFTSYWPYAGNAGGYAVGSLGLGFVPIIVGPLSLELRIDAGAAGGGGIPAGGGLMASGSAAIDVALDRGISLFARGGRFAFAKGFTANFAEAGLRYSFGWPVPVSAPAPAKDL